MNLLPALCLVLAGLGLGATTASGASWTPIGPDGGSTDAVAFDPVDPSTLYVAAFGAGLFKSTAGGASWARSDTGIDNTNELAVVVDPTHPQTVYTHTGDKVWKSTDGGASWTGYVTGLSFTVSLVMDPTNPQRLVAGGFARVAISADGGLTWTQHGNFGVAQVFHIAIDPATPTIVYVTSTPSFGGAVHRSTDGGLTYNQVLALPFPRGVLVDPVTSTTVFAWGEGGGLQRSVNAGLTWTAIGLGLSGSLTQDGLVVDSTTPSILYALTTDGLFRSTNGGLNWGSFGSGLLPGGLGHLVRDPANPARFAAGSSEGVALSTDGGLTWTHHVDGFRLHYIQALAYAPSDSSRFYAGSPLVGAWTSSDAGASWTRHPLDLGVISLVVHPTDPATAFATTSVFSPGIVLETTDGGTTWGELRAGLESAAITSVALASSSPNVLYAGSEAGFPGVFRSTDSGLNWSPTGGPGESIHAVAVDPTNPDRAYAAAGPFVYRSFDGGANWGPGVTFATVSSPQVSSLVIDPTLPSRIYYGVHAFPYGMFVSTDGGLTYDLTRSEPVNAVAVHPTMSGLVLIGTPSGVLASGDGGRSWVSYSANLAAAYIDAIMIVPGSPPLVFVGTDGQSVWRREITPCASVADCDDDDVCTIDTCAPGSPGADALGCRRDPVVCPSAGECQLAYCSPSSGCQISQVSDFTPCTSDDLPCTLDQCRGGVCTHDARVIFTCTQPVAPGGAKVSLARATPAKASLRARLGKLADTAPGSFGNPLTGGASDYAICVFDHSGAGGTDALVMGARAPAGGICGDQSCWSTRGLAFAYHDRERTPDGLDKMSLVPGSQGKARITAAGKGPSLPPVSGPFAPPIVVQIQRDDDPTACWSATFNGAISANTATTFKAKSD